MKKDFVHKLEASMQFFDLIGSDLTIADDTGTIIYVSEGYCDRHGISKDQILNVNCKELVVNDLFVPSIVEVCFNKRRKVTVAQKNPRGNVVLSTATPLFGNDGKIEYVLSYNAIDIADCSYAPLKFDKMSQILQSYINESMEISDSTIRTLNTRSKQMADIIQLIDQIASTEANILITGETGVGKSLLAKIIHDKDIFSGDNFVEINCSAIPESLVESELFGYEPGAFTGASSSGKLGKIELANNGTLFLDEISEVSLSVQSKLLHAIQEKKITRVGGTKNHDVNFRLITATNRDLREEINAKSFREDLYYRINVIPIHIPPLRERKEDILTLATYFLEQFNRKYEKRVSLSFEAMKVLEMQDWPGNIRELENYMERLVVLSNEQIITDNIIRADFTNNPESIIYQKDISLDILLEEYESRIIAEAFKEYKTSIEVAKHLGISQTTAARKIRKYIKKPL